VGVSTDDTEAVVDKMASKVSKLRIFEDEAGKTLWKSTVKQADAQILSGTLFTLLSGLDDEY
jgi:D-tyrosyl-tRNA(Tyr) deacylase